MNLQRAARRETGPRSSNETQVTPPQTPPTFLFHGMQRVPPENSIAFYLALRVGIPQSTRLRQRRPRGSGDPALAEACAAPTGCEVGSIDPKELETKFAMQKTCLDSYC
jgi:hypothetical protein